MSLLEEAWSYHSGLLEEAWSSHSCLGECDGAFSVSFQVDAFAIGRA
jgi:hypothetical protein